MFLRLFPEIVKCKLLQHFIIFFYILLHKKEPLRSSVFVLQPEWTSERESLLLLAHTSNNNYLILKDPLWKAEQVGKCILHGEDAGG